MSDFATQYGDVAIVPISVEAMCLRADEIDKTELTGAYADFSELTASEYRADRVSYLPRRKASLDDVGVHLQWALPPPFNSGIAQDSAGKNGDKVSFLPAPNRWLVVRFLEEIPPEAWVIESDFCSSEPQWNGVSVPMEPRNRQASAYLGRCCRLEDWMPRGDGQSAEKQLGWKLSAVGWGDPAFASYYPSCRNVFGFQDLLRTEEGDPIHPKGDLHYLVLGWHSRPEDDILSEKSRANKLFAAPLWTLTNCRDLALMRTSIFRGFVASVPWGESHRKSGKLTKETAKVVLGNSVQETVAALVASTSADEPDEQRFPTERLINGLLVGLDHSMPALDNAASHVDDALHMLRFLASDGGRNWSVRVKSAGVEKALEKAPDETPIPPAILTALAGYNAAQRELDYAIRLWTAHRRRIRDDLSHLEKMIWDPKSHHPEPGKWSSVRVKLRRRFERDMAAIYQIDIAHLSSRLDTARQEIEWALASAKAAQPEEVFEIYDVPAPRFWQPRDPVVLLKSPDIHAASRYGQGFRKALEAAVDLKQVPASHLPCMPAIDLPRVPALDLAKPAVDSPESDGDPFPEWNWDHLPYRRVFQRLVFQAGEFFYKGEGDADSFREKFSTVNPNQGGRPVFFQWTARYFPSPSAPTAAGSYDEGALETHWKFESTVCEHAELQSAGQNAWADRSVKLQGIALVESRAAKDLLDRLPDRLAKPAEGDGSHYISCTLSGFHERLLMYRSDFNLPLKDRARLLHLFGIPAWLETERQGDSLRPDPGLSEFSPLRAGGFQLVQLELIDTFGRIQKIPLENENLSLASSLTPTVEPEEKSTIALLPPRLCVPARLAFRLKSVGGDTDATSYQGPASPVCGWIIPSHLEKGLILCGQDGDMKGILRQPGKGAPIFLPAPGKKLAELHWQFRKLVDALLGQTLSVSELLENLEREILKIVPEQRQHEAGAAQLMGRPLAVVNAEMGIDLQGDLPPRRQVFDEEGLPATEDRGLLNVRVPVMLGDPARSNDGLAGFFLGEPGGQDFDFKNLWTPGGVLEDGKSRHPSLKIAGYGRGRRLRLLMLMDPQAPVHATTGLFPVKSISLPPAHFQAARRKLGVLFTMGPVLLPHPTQWTLPLQPVEDQVWHWAENSESAADRDPWAPVVEASALPLQTDLPSATALKGRIWLTLRANKNQSPSTERIDPS